MSVWTITIKPRHALTMWKCCYVVVVVVEVVTVIGSAGSYLSVSYVDAQRALELLLQYRAKLDQRRQNRSQLKQGLVEEDQQLHQSLDRVINVFQSQLFNALLGKDVFFHK